MSSIKELRNLIRKELDLYVENNMQEGSCSACAVDNPCPAHGGEAKMHRTTLAHLVADAQVLLKLVEDEDDLPDADNFFQASFVGSSPSEYEIRSAAFKEEHVGKHSLNITVADSEDGRASVVLSFEVVHATDSEA